MSDSWDQPEDDFLDQAAPAVKFEHIGVVHGGTITKVTKKQDTKPSGELKTYDNGDPMWVYAFELDSVKTLWVRGAMTKAIREALSGAKAKTVGTRIEVKYYADGPAKPGMNAPKLYMCRVLRPGDTPSPEAQPAPVPVAATAAPAAAPSVPW